MNNRERRTPMCTKSKMRSGLLVPHFTTWRYRIACQYWLIHDHSLGNIWLRLSMPYSCDGKDTFCSCCDNTESNSVDFLVYTAKSASAYSVTSKFIWVLPQSKVAYFLLNHQSTPIHELYSHAALPIQLHLGASRLHTQHHTCAQFL